MKISTFLSCIVFVVLFFKPASGQFAIITILGDTLLGKFQAPAKNYHHFITKEQKWIFHESFIEKVFDVPRKKEKFPKQWKLITKKEMNRRIRNNKKEPIQSEN